MVYVIICKYAFTNSDMFTLKVSGKSRELKANYQAFDEYAIMQICKYIGQNVFIFMTRSFFWKMTLMYD